MTDPAVMSGTMRTLANGDVEGRITDPFGYITVITGVITAPGTWSISAVVIVPDGLKLPFLDDEGAG